MKHTDQLNGKMFDKILCEKKTTKTIILVTVSHLLSLWICLFWTFHIMDISCSICLFLFWSFCLFFSVSEGMRDWSCYSAILLRFCSRMIVLVVFFSHNILSNILPFNWSVCFIKEDLLFWLLLCVRIWNDAT